MVGFRFWKKILQILSFNGWIHGVSGSCGGGRGVWIGENDFGVERIAGLRRRHGVLIQLDLGSSISEMDLRTNWGILSVDKIKT